MDDSLIKQLVENKANYLPHLSVDCVIFGFHEKQLKVLLLRAGKKNKWMLPGGFIGSEEPVHKAAERVLQQRTGLNEIFLQQFHVFGHPKRSKGANSFNEWFRKEGLEKNNWLLQRFITIGFYALVEYSKVQLASDIFSEESVWFHVNNLPPLMADHAEIVQTALHTLRISLTHQPIGLELLPKKFTIQELQALYETILDKKLDRRNFYRKIQSMNILKNLNEVKRSTLHKSPYLFSFDVRKYKKALQDDVFKGWS